MYIPEAPKRKQHKDKSVEKRKAVDSVVHHYGSYNTILPRNADDREQCYSTYHGFQGGRASRGCRGGRVLKRVPGPPIMHCYATYKGTLPTKSTPGQVCYVPYDRGVRLRGTERHTQQLRGTGPGVGGLTPPPGPTPGRGLSYNERHGMSGPYGRYNAVVCNISPNGVFYSTYGGHQCKGSDISANALPNVMGPGRGPGAGRSVVISSGTTTTTGNVDCNGFGR